MTHLLGSHTPIDSWNASSGLILPASQSTSITHDELIRLSAVDGLFFGKTFFPKTLRQDSADFHRDLWTYLDDPSIEFFAAEMFRGSAKTTTCRVWCAKRIAFGLSNLVFFTSVSQGHAIKSLMWLRKQIETNYFFTETFGLRKGAKWSDEWLEIVNTKLDTTINVVALGMTGQVRGLNIDDYRPDTILVDDPTDEESAGTEEQRAKQNQLLFGSIIPGRAPRSENPHSKVVLLATSQHKDDLLNQTHRDSLWRTIKVPIIRHTEDRGPVSNWPNRFPLSEILAQKKSASDRAQIHIWLREMECRIVGAENAAFNTALVKRYSILPVHYRIFAAIDPARSKQKKAHRAAIVFIGLFGNDIYVLEYHAQKGLNPEEIWNEFYRMAQKYPPSLLGIETIAYQQVLAWYFRQKMKSVNHFFNIREVQDSRSKWNRIRQAVGGAISDGRLHIAPHMTELQQMLDDYQDGRDFDLLDALAQAIDLTSPYSSRFNDAIEGDYEVLPKEDNIPDLDLEDGALCP